jgi:hypothetical protein
VLRALLEEHFKPTAVAPSDVLVALGVSSKSLWKYSHLRESQVDLTTNDNFTLLAKPKIPMKDGRPARVESFAYLYAVTAMESHLRAFGYDGYCEQSVFAYHMKA